MTSSFQRLTRTCVTGLALALACGAASAQSEVARPAVPQVTGCPALLAAAEQRYSDQVYMDVEPLVLDCVEDRAATQSEVQRAYRLLALSYIKQGLVTEAGRTVVRLLERDPSYVADPRTDLPPYVALVDGARDQLGIAVVQAEPPAPAVATPTRSSAPAPDVPAAGLVRVDVNTAGLEALDTVPGIGPALAVRIVAYREQNGPFRSAAELQNVPGIGPRSVERMLPYVTAGGAVAAPRPASASATDQPLVNVNTATAEELEALPGIGPALALRIVEFRASIGVFRDLNDLLQVRGIGGRKLEALAPFATVR